MLYAAYGSNLHPQRLAQRVTSVELIATAAVGGWELRFHKRGADGSAKCNIVRARAAGAEVRVAVFRLDPAELVKLDRAEGRGRGYEHAELTMPGHGRALTYVASPDHVDESLLPFPWYKTYVLAGCVYHRYPQSYVRAIEAQPVRPDPDARRHRRHMRFIARFAKS